MADAGDALGFVERPVVGWSNDVALFLGPRLSGYSGVDVTDLTRVEVESRRRMVAHLDHFRRHAPGFENAWLMLSAPQIGVRHTRRLVGRHKLTSEDWKARRPLRRRDRRLAVALAEVRERVGALPRAGPRRPRQRAGRGPPHRVRSADPGVHAGDPAVLDDRAGGRRRRGAGRVGERPAVADVDVAALRGELRRQGVYLQDEWGRFRPARSRAVRRAARRSRSRPTRRCCERRRRRSARPALSSAP